MGMKVRKGGVWRDIVSAKVFADGVWRELVQIKVYKTSAWRTVANFTAPVGGGGGGGGTLALSLNSTTISGSGSLSVIHSNPIVCTPSGGLTPYTYVWSIVSHDGIATYSIVTPGLASTRVNASGQAAGTTGECIVHCVVTDALGTTATSSNVDVLLTRTAGQTE